jgi:outer membrane lipoprotein-sorting protein
MTKSIKLFLALILFILANQLCAQNAEKILADATEKMKSFKTIKLDFTYQMFNAGAGINETNEGSAILSGDKYRLEIAGQVIISDSITLWTIITDAGEVQVNEAGTGEDAFSPTKMLTDYKENYTSKLIKEVTELNGKNVYLLELIPHEVKNFEKVNLFLLSDDLQPYRIELFDFNESVYKYTLNNFQTGIELPQNAFSFTEEEFPGFDVIDMR